MDVKASLPDSTTCPSTLRFVLDRWKSGNATDAALVEASYAAQLDVLNEYRPRPLPTPPEELCAFRALSVTEQQEVDKKKKERMLERCERFLKQESVVLSKNAAHAFHVKELLEWVTSRGVSDSIRQRVQTALHHHQDRAQELEDSTPFLA